MLGVCRDRFDAARLSYYRCLANQRWPCCWRQRSVTREVAEIRSLSAPTFNKGRRKSPCVPFEFVGRRRIEQSGGSPEASSSALSFVGPEQFVLSRRPDYAVDGVAASKLNKAGESEGEKKPQPAQDHPQVMAGGRCQNFRVQGGVEIYTDGRTNRSA